MTPYIALTSPNVFWNPLPRFLLAAVLVQVNVSPDTENSIAIADMYSPLSMPHTPTLKHLIESFPGVLNASTYWLVYVMPLLVVAVSINRQ